MSISGSVTLFLKVSGPAQNVAVEFLVVDTLVVPILLGTPWIDQYVSSIHPKLRTVTLQLDPNQESFEAQLRSHLVPNSSIVRFHLLLKRG
jgi:hypothetical protein